MNLPVMTRKCFYNDIGNGCVLPYDNSFAMCTDPGLIISTDTQRVQSDNEWIFGDYLPTIYVENIMYNVAGHYRNQ